MARQLRVEFPGAIYHVLSRGVGRMDIFLDDEDRIFFLDLVEKAVLDEALVVHAYCLMPNHFHLLAETPRGELGRWMHGILGRYAGRFNWRHERFGHLWQERYKAILVEDGKYFLDCSRYIHLNPYKARMARPAERYRWSSYRNYVGGVPAIDWVSTDRIMRLFASPDEYRRFVEAGQDEALVNPFELASAGIALGSEKFVKDIRSLAALRGNPQETEIPSLRRLRRGHAGIPVDVVQEAVSKVFGEFSDLQKSRMLVYALRECTWMKSVEIAELVGKTSGAVTHTVKVIGERLRKDPRMARRYGELLRELRAVVGADGAVS